MKKLTALLLALLLLASAEATAGRPTCVRYVPAPEEAFSGTADRVLAATPDGRYLLIGIGDMYIWDTAENRKIPLTIPAPDDAVLFGQVMQYAEIQFRMLGGLGMLEAAEREAKLNEMLEQFRETALIAAEGETCFRTMDQVHFALQLGGMNDPNYQLFGISDRYALVSYSYIAPLLIIRLETGECRVFNPEDSWRNPILAGDRILVKIGEEMTWHAWDIIRNEMEELALPEQQVPESALTRFIRDETAALDAAGNLWRLASDDWWPTTDEEMEAFRLHLLDPVSGRDLQIPVPQSYWIAMTFIRDINKIYITGEGRWALLEDNKVNTCFVVVNLSDGSASWNRGTNSGSADFGDETTPLLPVSAADNGFICYDPGTEQLVFLDPETMEHMALTFEMRSDDLPGQYRETGMIGIRTGEIWTTITPRMVRQPAANTCGMIFSTLPGYLVVE